MERNDNDTHLYNLSTPSEKNHSQGPDYSFQKIYLIYGVLMYTAYTRVYPPLRHNVLLYLIKKYISFQAIT